MKKKVLTKTHEIVVLVHDFPRPSPALHQVAQIENSPKRRNSPCRLEEENISSRHGRVPGKKKKNSNLNRQQTPVAVGPEIAPMKIGN
jgi:hypothetical protein